MKRYNSAAILSAIFLMAGCSDRDDSSKSGEVFSGGEAVSIDFSTHTLGLTRADSCDAYRRHILDAAARRIADHRFGLFREYPVYALEDAVYAESNDAGGSEGAAEFTATNNQEEGVDEVDYIKNDQNWIYSALNRRGEVAIAKTWPVEEAKFVAKIPVESIDNADVYNLGLLLDGTKLIAIDHVTRYNYKGFFWYHYADSSTRIRVYDVSDPTQPTLIKTHEMEGDFVQGRLIDHRVHLVLSASTRKLLSELNDLYYEDIPGLPKFDRIRWSEDYSMEKRKENIEKYLPFIRGWLEKKYPDSSFFQWPQYSDGTNHKDLISCTDVFIPSTTSRDFGMLMMTELSGENFDKVSAQAISDSGWTVYASKKNMYVVSSSSNWTYDCYEDSSCHYYSHIHRFDLGNGDGLAHYANSGEVDGTINSQFFMSEYDGYLRVASDENIGWADNKNGSRLSILSLDGPQMRVVSSLGDIGNGESLYAARMFGSKGYMVTYKQTDPLFTFDLSDPLHPVKKGELKINGYSSYIHFMDENHLLTIGQDGTEDGRTTGLQLQVFDVSDLANPKRTAQEVFTNTDTSYAWSYALEEHHAFNFHAGSGLLAIPMVINTWTNVEPYTTNYWGGEYVYRVSADKFELLGKIAHDGFGEENKEAYFPRSRYYFADSSDYSKNAYIYSVSYIGMKINDANAPSNEFKTIFFEGK